MKQSEVVRYNFLAQGGIVPILEAPYMRLKNRIYRLYYNAVTSTERRGSAPRMIHPSVLSERWWINFFYSDLDFSQYSRSVKDYRTRQTLLRFLDSANDIAEDVLKSFHLISEDTVLEDGGGFTIRAQGMRVTNDQVHFLFAQGKKVEELVVKFWSTHELEIALRSKGEVVRKEGWKQLLSYFLCRADQPECTDNYEILIHLSPYYVIKAIEWVPAQSAASTPGVQDAAA